MIAVWPKEQLNFGWSSRRISIAGRTNKMPAPCGFTRKQGVSARGDARTFSTGA
jgi:hypothetical protein